MTHSRLCTGEISNHPSYTMRCLDTNQEPQEQHRAESCDLTWLLGLHAVFTNWLIYKELESHVKEANSGEAGSDSVL